MNYGIKICMLLRVKFVNGGGEKGCERGYVWKRFK